MSIKKIYLSEESIKSLVRGKGIDDAIDSIVNIWLVHDAIISTDKVSSEIVYTVNEYINKYPNVTEIDKRKTRIKLSKWAF